MKEREVGFVNTTGGNEAQATISSRKERPKVWLDEHSITCWTVVLIVDFTLGRSERYIIFFGRWW